MNRNTPTWTARQHSLIKPLLPFSEVPPSVRGEVKYEINKKKPLASFFNLSRSHSDSGSGGKKTVCRVRDTIWAGKNRFQHHQLLGAAGWAYSIEQKLTWKSFPRHATLPEKMPAPEAQRLASWATPLARHQVMMQFNQRFIKRMKRWHRLCGETSKGKFHFTEMLFCGSLSVWCGFVGVWPRRRFLPFVWKCDHISF